MTPGLRFHSTDSLALADAVERPKFVKRCRRPRTIDRRAASRRAYFQEECMGPVEYVARIVWRHLTWILPSITILAGIVAALSSAHVPADPFWQSGLGGDIRGIVVPLGVVAAG